MHIQLPHRCVPHPLPNSGPNWWILLPNPITSASNAWTFPPEVPLSYQCPSGGPPPAPPPPPMPGFSPEAPVYLGFSRGRSLRLSWSRLPQLNPKNAVSSEIWAQCGGWSSTKGARNDKTCKQGQRECYANPAIDSMQYMYLPFSRRL